MPAGQIVSARLLPQVEEPTEARPEVEVEVEEEPPPRRRRESVARA